MSYYEYRHIVSFEETNLVGNVYYTNHLGWQGRCRELFLREHAPEVIQELSRGLSLATMRCSCEYLAEITAFDEILVRMRLTELVQNRMALSFEYWRRRPDGEELIARGEQHVACMRREQGRLAPAPLPASLRQALAPYSERAMETLL
jgi:enediyne core biosynthesis thioesterase